MSSERNYLLRKKISNEAKLEVKQAHERKKSTSSSGSSYCEELLLYEEVRRQLWEYSERAKNS